MPLHQPEKDAALVPAQQSKAALEAWPDDVPEKSALVSSAGTLVAGIEAAVVPPPAPVQLPDSLVVFDVPLNKGSQGLVGSTTSDFLYTPLYPWTKKGGDFGALLGSSPKLVPGQTGQILVSLTLPPDCTQLCLRAKTVTASAPTLKFNSRSTLAGPQITYLSATGQQTSALAVADVECNGSTTAEIGGNPTLSVRPGSNSIFLRFPPPPADTISALLAISLVQVSDAQGILEVYDGTIRLPAPPTDTFILKGDPRVFFETQCFEDAPGYIKAMIFGDTTSGHPPGPDRYQQRSIVVDETGQKVLQLTFDPRVNAVCTASILFPDAGGKPGAEADEAACEFDIRFLPDMEQGMTQGFKCAFGWSSNTKNDDATFAQIWGLPLGRCGTLLAGNGGAKTHGDDGWSLRFDAFAPVTPADHPLYRHVIPMQYAYWPLQADFYGDPWPWNLCQFSPRLGQWHTITQRAKINSMNADGSFNKDAELDGFTDHKLALRRRGFYLRTTDKPLISLPISPSTPWAGVSSKLAIGRVWFNIYHGGTALPRSRCSFQIRNFRAAKFA